MVLCSAYTPTTNRRSCLRAVERGSRLHVGQDGVAHHHRVHFVVGARRDHKVRVVGQALDDLETLDVCLEGLHSCKLRREWFD